MIEIKNLTKRYNNVALFSGLNLHLEAKQLIFITGKSGSGKSTLLNLIGGLEKLDKGSINFYDQNHQNTFSFKSDDKHTKLNPDVDFVFQNFNLLSGISSQDNLKIANYLKNKSLSAEDTETLFQSVDLDLKRKKNKVELLSGGEKQRLSILRALSRDAAIILADEPTGNLDTKNSDIIFQKLKSVSQSKTVIVVSHDLISAQKYANRIIHLEDGKIVKDEIIKNANTYEQPQSLITFNQSASSKLANKLRPLPIFLKRDIKSKWVQTLLLIIFSVVSLLSIIGALQVNAFSFNTNQVANRSLLDTDIVRVHSKKLNDNEFDKTYLDNFKEDYDITKTINLFSDNSSFDFFSPTASQPVGSLVDVVDTSEFFSERYQNTLTKGHFLKKENDIVISEKLASALNLDEPLGKEISIIYHHRSFPTKLEIVGITNKEDIIKQGISFIDFRFLNKLVSTNLEAGNFILRKKSEFVADTNLVKTGAPLKFSDDNLKIFDSNETLVPINNVNSKIPDNPNETILVINSQEINNFKIDNPNNQFLKALKEESLWTLEGSESFQMAPEVKIVGIYQSDTSASGLRVLANDLMHWKTFKAIEHKLYLQDISQVAPLTKIINNNLGSSWSATNNLSSVTNLINNSGRLVSVILYIAIFVFTLVTFLFVLLYSKFLADTKAKDIGILKTLGASHKLAALFHTTNIFFANLVILVTSLIFYLPLQELLKSQIQNFNLLDINHGQVISVLIAIWVALSLILSGLYYLIGYLYFRKRTIKLLQQ